jgi:hypothetical protein
LYLENFIRGLGKPNKGGVIALRRPLFNPLESDSITLRRPSASTGRKTVVMPIFRKISKRQKGRTHVNAYA